MSYPHTSFFANEVDDTAQLARDLAQAVSSQLPTDAVIYLNGDLGAGKTTFSRYFIQSLGIQVALKVQPIHWLNLMSWTASISITSTCIA